MKQGSEWIGEIITFRGQLWTVTGVAPSGEYQTWLDLEDHYGSGDTTQARASDVEVALQ